MKHSLISLTTDFGLKDPLVAEMKAVILSICPNTTIVDITHQVEKFNVRMGAYILASAFPYFPENTVHVAVVDPGVGGKRRCIAAKTRRGCFVGPDNGIMALALKNIDGSKHVYEISQGEFMLPKIANTFHGRDILAPAAAYLAKGKDPAKFGPEIHGMVAPEFATVLRKKSGLEGQIVHIDDFGNVITNFTEKELEAVGIKDKIRFEVSGLTLQLKLVRAYNDVGIKRPLATIGGHGFLEIALNQGNASERLKLKVEDKILLGSVK
jgi:S-adenosylmethionine hydrolase